MTKEELCKKLKYTYDLWEEVDYLRNQNKRLSVGKYTDCITLFCLVGTVLGYIIYVFWYANAITENIIATLLLGIPLAMLRGLVLPIVIGISWYIIIFILDIRERKKNKKEIQSNNFKINNILCKIKETSVVPPKYLNKNYIGRFIDYLENIRADNLKECINILEQEVSNEERIQVMKDNQKILLENQRILRNIEINTEVD